MTISSHTTSISIVIADSPDYIMYDDNPYYTPKALKDATANVDLHGTIALSKWLHEIYGNESFYQMLAKTFNDKMGKSFEIPFANFLNHNKEIMEEVLKEFGSTGTTGQAYVSCLNNGVDCLIISDKEEYYHVELKNTNGKIVQWGGRGVKPYTADTYNSSGSNLWVKYDSGIKFHPVSGIGSKDKLLDTIIAKHDNEHAIFFTTVRDFHTDHMQKFPDVFALKASHFNAFLKLWYSYNNEVATTSWDGKTLEANPKAFFKKFKPLVNHVQSLRFNPPQVKMRR